VVAQVGVADPLRGGGAAVAAEPLCGAIDGGGGGDGRQRLAAVEAAGPLALRVAHGGGRGARARAHVYSWLPEEIAGLTCAARSPAGRRPCRRQGIPSGITSSFQSWSIAISASARQPLSPGSARSSRSDAAR